MSLPKFKELNNLNTLVEIEQEILLLQKNLFDLRIKQLTNQKVQFHLFSHYKRRIAQLNLKKNIYSKN